jgi:hypothetical protein
MRAFLRGRCFCSSLDAEESSMLSKGRFRETAGITPVGLVDAPMVAASVGADLRVPGGSMIRIFLTLNPSGERKKLKYMRL